MNVSSARKFSSRRIILSGMAGLILMAAPIMVIAAAADPYDPPNDVGAYQAYTGQNTQYGKPMPPPGQYPGAPSYADRNQLESQLNYAEAQYNQAQQAGDQGAAKHWRKQIKHLKRELSGGGYVGGPGYGSPSYMRPQGPSYAPPASAYGPPTQEYAPSGYGYAQPYPSTGYPLSGYPNAGAPRYAQPYSLSGYPNGGYANGGYPYGASASPYGAPGASGQTGSGGLSSLLGPLLGGGASPSAGYPQSGYPNAAAGSPYGTPSGSGQAGAMGGLGSLLGPLLGGGAIP
jgi:hypothetical protein